MSIQAIKLCGRLTDVEKASLSLVSPNEKPFFDTSDIPLKIYKGLTEGIISIKNSYLGVLYRKGGFNCLYLTVSDIINDGVSLQSGKANIEFLEVVHNLDFVYSKYNHADCIQIFSYPNRDKPVKDVRIKRVELTLLGKGWQDKGCIMLTETCGYERLTLFQEGFVIRQPRPHNNLPPAFNAISLSNSTLGSPKYPLNNRDLAGRSIRIMDVKRGAQETKDVIIYAKRGVHFEFTGRTRKGITIKYV